MVNAQEQWVSGTGLEPQRGAILAKSAHRGWELLAIYQDVASGKSQLKRPELNKCLAQLKAHPDALVVAKLDRLSSSVPSLGAILADAGHQTGRRWLSTST